LNTGHDRPYRFSFYSNALSATIHARSLSELPAEGQSFTDLFAGTPAPREASAARDRPDSAKRPGPSPIVHEKSRHTNYGDPESNTWWLDVQSPTDDEMKMLSKVL
jgi:magnesium transporter